MASAFAGVLLGSGCFDVAGYDDFVFQPPLRGELEQTRIDRIDLLFVIDNSRGIGDKHDILRETLETFVGRLVNPRCVDREGRPGAQPELGEACPAGERRELEPVRDMHIGVITSSLGGHGGDACAATLEPSENDRAHLVDRKAPGSSERVPTYEGLGFLAWDAAGSHDPPGETDLTRLVGNLSAIVDGVGEVGCGYEAPLEAWYRFLVDPEPYLDLEVVNDVTQLSGVDDVVLAQRAAFMRPDSLLAIVMVTDENDCSTRDGGTFHLSSQIFQPGTNNPYRLPKARAACAVDPNDACCRSCGQNPGDGCDTSQDDCNTPLDPIDDSINLRCFDQKRRFGIDFLYPVDRYVTGLRAQKIPNRTGELVDNPLLSGRPAGRVVLAGIVGVPWQDIARTNAEGEPDLVGGLDVLDNVVGGVKNASELLLPVAGFQSAWDIILGDPDTLVPPADPLMIESIDPRSGTPPLVPDEPLTAPGAMDANEVNGGEYVPAFRDDLQHACIFGGKDCTQTADPTCLAGRGQSCDGYMCREGLTCAEDLHCAQSCDADPFDICCTEEDPLCRDSEGNFTTLKYKGSAYPGLRLLQVLRDARDQGIVGSICPKQTHTASSPDFGFTPALEGAVVERLKGSLKEHLCLDRSLIPDAVGHVRCTLVEARDEPDGDTCTEVCSAAGRRPATDAHAAAVALAKGDPERGCFCEMVQLTSAADLRACRDSVSETVRNEFGQGVNGWCFVDATTSPPLGEPALVAACPADRRRVIRLVGLAQQAQGSRLYLHCE